MSNQAKLQKKINSSAQFKQVAHFIKEISDLEGNLTDKWFFYFAVCPWTNDKLALRVSNINTTLFCQLFPRMKPTSCERHLRLYKELTREA